jgi:hypothetical protein
VRKRKKEKEKEKEKERNKGGKEEGKKEERKKKGGGEEKKGSKIEDKEQRTSAIFLRAALLNTTPNDERVMQHSPLMDEMAQHLRHISVSMSSLSTQLNPALLPALAKAFFSNAKVVMLS